MNIFSELPGGDVGRSRVVFYGYITALLLVFVQFLPINETARLYGAILLSVVTTLILIPLYVFSRLRLKDSFNLGHCKLLMAIFFAKTSIVILFGLTSYLIHKINYELIWGSYLWSGIEYFFAYYVPFFLKYIFAFLYILGFALFCKGKSFSIPKIVKIALISFFVLLSIFYYSLFYSWDKNTKNQLSEVVKGVWDSAPSMVSVVDLENFEGDTLTSQQAYIHQYALMNGMTEQKEVSLKGFSGCYLLSNKETKKRLDIMCFDREYPLKSDSNYIIENFGNPYQNGNNSSVMFGFDIELDQVVYDCISADFGSYNMDRHYQINCNSNSEEIINSFPPSLSNILRGFWLVLMNLYI